MSNKHIINTIMTSNYEISRDDALAAKVDYQRREAERDEYIAHLYEINRPYRTHNDTVALIEQRCMVGYARIKRVCREHGVWDNSRD